MKKRLINKEKRNAERQKKKITNRAVQLVDQGNRTQSLVVRGKDRQTGARGVGRKRLSRAPRTGEFRKGEAS